MWKKSPKMSQRVNGTVKWFNSQKGFGFIQPENGPDVFVHHTRSVGRLPRVNEGERVEFEITQGPKGPQASNVVRLGG